MNVNDRPPSPSKALATLAADANAITTMTSMTTVTDNTTEVKRPRAPTSLITAMVDGGESANSTVLPSTATANTSVRDNPSPNDANGCEPADAGSQHNQADHGHAARDQDDGPDSLAQLGDEELASGHERDQTERNLVDEPQLDVDALREDVEHETARDGADGEIPGDVGEPQRREPSTDAMRRQRDETEDDEEFECGHVMRWGLGTYRTGT